MKYLKKHYTEVVYPVIPDISRHCPMAAHL